MDFDSLQGRSQTEVDFQTHLPRFLPISARVDLGRRIGRVLTAHAPDGWQPPSTAPSEPHLRTNRPAPRHLRGLQARSKRCSLGDGVCSAGSR